MSQPVVSFRTNRIANPSGTSWHWCSVTQFDDDTLRKAARNRQMVVLVTGERVTLLSWGNSGGAARARVQWANGRQRTLKQVEVKGLVCDQLHS